MCTCKVSLCHRPLPRWVEYVYVWHKPWNWQNHEQARPERRKMLNNQFLRGEEAKQFPCKISLAMDPWFTWNEQVSLGSVPSCGSCRIQDLEIFFLNGANAVSNLKSLPCWMQRQLSQITVPPSGRLHLWAVSTKKVAINQVLDRTMCNLILRMKIIQHNTKEWKPK